jgi:hypothetical protein
MVRTLNRIITTLFLVCCCSLLYSQSVKTEKRLNGLVESELKSVQKAYDDCLINRCYGDSIFFKNWLDGLNCEKGNRYDEALKLYLKAYHCERFEMATYDLEYSLGRVEIRQGNISKGKDYLGKFIANATNDLNNEDSMWGFTEEAENELKSRISQARDLVKEY